MATYSIGDLDRREAQRPADQQSLQAIGEPRAERLVEKAVAPRKPESPRERYRRAESAVPEAERECDQRDLGPRCRRTNSWAICSWSMRNRPRRSRPTSARSSSTRIVTTLCSARPAQPAHSTMRRRRASTIGACSTSPPRHQNGRHWRRRKMPERVEDRSSDERL